VEIFTLGEAELDAISGGDGMPPIDPTEPDGGAQYAAWAAVPGHTTPRIQETQPVQIGG
jgi:hypothetical protein